MTSALIFHVRYLLKEELGNYYYFFFFKKKKKDGGYLDAVMKYKGFGKKMENVD